MSNEIAGLVVLILMSLPFASGAADISGAATVVDGDTLTISTNRIRLHAIDAPEGRQSCRRGGVDWLCGQEATAKLRTLVDGQVVSCLEIDQDRYGRIVAVCRAGQVELGEAMVSSGLALAYREFGQDYVPYEAAAEEAKRGLWAGEFVAPWRWRAGERLSD